MNIDYIKGYSHAVEGFEQHINHLIQAYGGAIRVQDIINVLNGMISYINEERLYVNQMCDELEGEVMDEDPQIHLHVIIDNTKRK